MNLRICTILSLGFCLTACPADETDDDDGNSTAAETGTPGTTTGAPMTGADSTGMGSTSTPGGSSEGGSTAAGPMCDSTDPAAITECEATAMGMGTCPEVYECVCGSCVCELAACQEDAGCVAIRDCAQETGCLGLDCYMMETCMEVIDANGGPVGDSASIAISLSTCTEGAACPIQCPGDTTGGSDSTGSGSGGSDSGGTTGTTGG
ncbi:MAG: hypothetical protein AAF721_10540 [Myxococcota bacterium]